MDQAPLSCRNAAVTLHLGDHVTVLLPLPDVPADALVTLEIEEATQSQPPRYAVSFHVVHQRHSGGPAAIDPAISPAPASTDTDTDADAGAGAGVRVGVPEIAEVLLSFFAEQGNPQALTVAQLADRLAAADPATWDRWNGRTDRLAMVGRTLKDHLKKAGLNVPTTRLSTVAGQPTAYWEADIRAALREIGAAW